jgi:hypothetical protein
MKIKKHLIILSSMIILSCTSNKTKEKETTKEEHAQHDHSAHTGTSNSKSPRNAAMANIGPVHVHIDYSAPSVRGREIFGGLVAFGEVWVTGAHSATSISFDDDLLIEGVKVEKGKYALFTIPGREEWTVILNRNYNQHLADDYNEDDDVMRWKLENINLNEQTEQLVFIVKSVEINKGNIEFKWSDRSFLLNIIVAE